MTKNCACTEGKACDTDLTVKERAKNINVQMQDDDRIITFGIPKEICKELNWGKDKSLKHLKLTVLQDTDGRTILQMKECE